MKLDTSGLESFSAAVPSAMNVVDQLGADQVFGPASFELPAGCADVFSLNLSFFTFSHLRFMIYLLFLICFCFPLRLIGEFVSCLKREPPSESGL